MNEKIQLELDVFVGPLDLLLHLIKKLEVDIYDIPIREITHQYMNYIRAMQTLELEIAGEYLVMASTLMAIKSQMLLPTQTYEGEEVELDEEEGIDPREALVEQLLEYRKYKYAAHLLHEKEEERKLYYTKEPMNIENFKEKDVKLPALQYNTIDLFLAFHQMLEKKQQRQPKETIIETEEISIEERMNQIVARIAKIKSGTTFDSFFEYDVSKSEVITTFMAILELMKKKQITIQQENNFTPILLFGVSGVSEEE